MKYKCLVLDHDDTVVESTASVHYPAFVEILKILRPNESISLEDYFIKNFEFGFLDLCRKFYSFSEEELKFEENYWKEYAKNKPSLVFPGMKELLWEYKKSGGIICVVSFSLTEYILRDYKANSLPLPDMVFGWEEPIEKRKPSAYPIEQIIKAFGLKKEEILVVDDANHGLNMAINAGVDFTYAGWAHNIEKIHKAVKNISTYYFKDVWDLKEFIK